MQNPGDELRRRTSRTRCLIDYSIEDGRGAFVHTGDWDDVTGLRSYVVDPRGTAYSLVDAQTIEKLGYDEDPVPLVPDSWVELFVDGRRPVDQRRALPTVRRRRRRTRSAGSCPS